MFEIFNVEINFLTSTLQAENMYRFLILSDFFQKMPMRISTYSDIGGEFANDGTLSIGSLTSFRGVQSLIKIYL